MFPLPQLHFAKFRFVLEAAETLFLPAYKGSTLRGGFGHAFRKVVCTMGPIPCETCLLQLKCPYPQFFETPVVGEPPPFMRGVKTGPQPFVLEPPPERKKKYAAGERLEFDLVLIGRAIEHLPYFIYTFDRLGSMGIGRRKGKFRLREVRSCGAEPIRIYDDDSKVLTADYAVLSQTPDPSAPDAPTQLTLRFLTPTRIKVGGHLTIELTFREIVLNVLRRASTLSHFHVPDSDVNWDWKEILNAANAVETTCRLNWYDWERYSNRQKTRMKLGGFVGDVQLRGELGEWLPLLRLGEFVHVGKGATFGLGKYEVRVEVGRNG